MFVPGFFHRLFNASWATNLHSPWRKGQNYFQKTDHWVRQKFQAFDSIYEQECYSTDLFHDYQANKFPSALDCTLYSKWKESHSCKKLRVKKKLCAPLAISNHHSRTTKWLLSFHIGHCLNAKAFQRSSGIRMRYTTVYQQYHPACNAKPQFGRVTRYWHTSWRVQMAADIISPLQIHLSGVTYCMYQNTNSTDHLHFSQYGAPSRTR